MPLLLYKYLLINSFIFPRILYNFAIFLRGAIKNLASVGPLALLVLTWRLPAVVNRDFLIVNCFTAFVLEEIGFIQGGYVIGAVSGKGVLDICKLARQVFFEAGNTCTVCRIKYSRSHQLTTV